MLPSKLYYHLTTDLSFRCFRINTILPNERINGQDLITLYKRPLKIGEVRLTINSEKLSLSYPVSEYNIDVYRVNSVSIPQLNLFVELVELDRMAEDSSAIDDLKRLAIQKGLSVRYY